MYLALCKFAYQAYCTDLQSIDAAEAQAHDGELDHENRRLQLSACRNVRLKWLATLRDGRLGDQRRRVPEDAGEERAATSRSRQSPQ
jgi:hypothetical protein